MVNDLSIRKSIPHANTSKPFSRNAFPQNLSAPSHTGRILASMCNSAATATQKEIVAYAALARGWLGGLMLWFCDVYDRLPAPAQRWRPLADAVAQIKARIVAELRRTARELRIVLIAGARWRACAPATRIHHKSYPGAPRAGLRRSPRAFHFRRRVTALVLRGIHDGSPRQRAQRLAAIFDDLDALILRVARRLEAMWRCVAPNGLILTAACDAIASLCLSPAASADTS